MIPEIARADFETPHRPMMQMAGDAERALPPNLTQHIVCPLIGADVLLDVERNDVEVRPRSRDLICRRGARQT